MTFLRQHGPDTYWYDCLHYHPDKDIAEMFAKDCADAGIDADAVTGQNLVVAFLAEGHDHSVAGKLIQWLQETLHPQDLKVLYNTINPDTLPYWHQDRPLHLANFMNFLDQVLETTAVDVKFLCLIRRASASRARLASGLHQMPSVRMSFGSMAPVGPLPEFQSMFSVPLPIMLDGPVSYDQQHSHSDPKFYTCLFNIVAESSSQTDPGIWRSIFITEKTYKAFGFRQIPIWSAVPGFVAQVRKLGFDVFDDIVDHSYDTVQDECQRIDLVIKEVKRLDSEYKLQDCQQLRQQLWPRLQANFALLAAAAQQQKEMRI